MAEWVVDTNILLVATRVHLGAPPRRLAARGEDIPALPAADQRKIFEWLKALRASREQYVVVDVPHNLIEAEYRRKLEKNEYGRMVIAEKLTRGECRFVEVTRDEQDHAIVMHEAGEEVFDLDDRKMVAVAVESGAPIVNACDTDWCELEERGTLGRLGITVHHLAEAWCRAQWQAKKDKAEQP